MQLPFFLGTLLLSVPGLAAPGFSRRTSTPLQTPSITSLGALQVLHYNNLHPENNGTAAVLVYNRLSHADALARCATIGESLYPLPNVPEANRTELDHQLDYLAFAQDIKSNDSFWVSMDLSNECWAYSHSRKEIFQALCHNRFPAICTSNVPPTTDQNRTVVTSSKISLAFDDYNITGYRDSRSFRFLGIPFADPPVKNLRLAPPQAYTGSRKIDATKASASCIQSVSAFGTLGAPAISEDCLYLNVFTPVLPGNGSANSTRRPVAVYLYGGAFTAGSASMIDYDGGNFASRNDVVVVTVNYRVGALGFLATGNLTSGSYGTRDQIMALEWVNKHIAAFGGDPSQVTIFGQSAGGQSVIALLSSTKAHGLFSGAIVQSAPVDLPWFPRGVYSELISPIVAEAVGCDKTQNETALLSCLRSIPATRYLDNSTEFSSALTEMSKTVSSDYLHVSTLLASIEPFMPMVDDSGSGVIDDQFYTLLANDRLPNRVPTMFTTVTDEASLYIAQYIPNLGASSLALDALYKTAFPSDLANSIIKSGAFAVNRGDPDGARNAAADALTHAEWVCPQSYLLNNTGKNSFPSLYQVEITQGHMQTTSDVPEICSPNDNYSASCHSSDVLPIWGTLNSKTQNVAPYYDERDILHSQLLNDIFGSFFRTHNPNPDPAFLKARGPAYASTYEIFGAQGYHMSQFHPEDKQLSLLGMPPSLADNPGFSDKCAVLKDYGFTFQHANLTA
ncbi:hypothetical protein ASPWEDRAFT_42435 [Aspergillus wentii DTO 134E9]|uniref:Carboxylesterase type B domain-containing protein n=1 Tax=Aspergillus wentii DTO 134E9 TaxID=1073089 RepID=A0A1L9RHM6_ASPWE|nr:uncharacterized protein ASPWEDRAFT_42435 [Aspergillus wentii DTO 134E9]KAI9925762.1 hypothetical protein MW887_005568 [Aspergillus wentii]OJJ34431.1 hypothetical protein ASPWEDRAFT_42435 [Aspergillus wentii DTO 134E9]